MTWTHFWDMNSGGGQKEDWAHIFIEAPRAEAELVFYNRFGHNPNRVTCTCCGEDYSISESESLEQESGYHRNLRFAHDAREKNGFYLEPGEDVPSGFKVSQYSAHRFGEQMTLDEYLATPDVLVIRAGEIKEDEKTGTLPEQGYVWR